MSIRIKILMRAQGSLPVGTDYNLSLPNRGFEIYQFHVSLVHKSINRGNRIV